MTLPIKPGLHRRLAYGDQIRHRNRRHNFLSINLFPEQNYNLINEHMNRFNRQGSDTSVRQGSDTFYTYEQLVTLEDVKVGLNTNDLVRNSKVSLNKTSFLCSICQDNSEVIIRILKCNHYFHITCIDKWLSNNKTCPVCRYNLEN
jgi:hypothetical protein